MEEKNRANIIGAGLAGLSAAITLAKLQIPCRLISLLPSERSQSVLAEGGINGALNTMGEGDSPEYHFEDTMKAGVFIADPQAVRNLTEHAPEILMELKKLGVPFNLKEEQIQLRSFGGQKKKRTAYARSSTGKVLMTALIDEARKYEAQGLIRRYSRHELADLVLTEACGGQEQTAGIPVESRGGTEAVKRCQGVLVRDTCTDEILAFSGPVILATGGLNGLFPDRTTGTVTNSGDASSLAFTRGIAFSNLEMIQYHPTTIQIAGKRCLVSEAARGEGGRLYIQKGGKPWFFMEEKYPELGNLMPRDVVSREIWFVTHDSGDAEEEHSSRQDQKGKESRQGQDFRKNQVYLDMHHLPKEIWEKRLPDLRSEVIHYLGLDPAKDPIPVDPGIHYFMGGIDVDAGHHTNIAGLYAAGECCSQYHGANRLGGNSTLGAIYGGKAAARTLAEEIGAYASEDILVKDAESAMGGLVRESIAREIGDILYGAMGIVRSRQGLEDALEQLQQLLQRHAKELNAREKARILLARAMLLSAAFRKESRGAHYRSDYPEPSDQFAGKTLALAADTPEGVRIGCESVKPS